MSQTAGTVVVGGGIAGAFAAYHLAELGAEVTLVERDEIGGQASGHNPGGLKPLHGAGIPGPLEGLALESFRMHLEGWETILELSGLDFSPRRAPRLHLAADEDDVDALERLKGSYDSTPGFSAQWLEREELLTIEPELDPALYRGLWTEGTAKVDPGAYTRAVAAAAGRLGAKTVRAEVRGLKRSGDRVTGVLLDSGALRCDGVVVATGPWCAEPSTWLGTTIPIEPLKGEMLLAERERASDQIDLVWRDAQVYEAGPGRIWLAGTEERARFDRTPSASGRATILDRVARIAPSLRDVRVLRQTAGLRPLTPDCLPIVGLPAGWSNACLAMGAGRKGMLLSAAMGRAAAELLTQGETELPVESSSPLRFEGAAEAVA
jgi:glycine oxidase